MYRTTSPQLVIIHSADHGRITTVDAKLVYLVQQVYGILLTNDYNLSKVANLQKVVILNNNDIAQAICPIYLLGDTIKLKILKQGT